MHIIIGRTMDGYVSITSLTFEIAVNSLKSFAGIIQALNITSWDYDSSLHFTDLLRQQLEQILNNADAAHDI